MSDAVDPVGDAADLQGFAGYQEPGDTTSEFSAQSFVINQIIGRLATAALVKVVAVTSTGGVAPVGFVDVQPMVNQVDGVGNPTPHTTIHNLPYFRLQGGTTAIIVDPSVGDEGVVVFCSRDISTVKRTKTFANPGSSRRFDWADGIYIGGFLNGTPVQYIEGNADGFTISSPTKITLTAPNIVLNGDTATTGALTNNGHSVGSMHLHTASGGTGIGGPPE